MKREDIIELLGDDWEGFRRLLNAALISDIASLNSVNSLIVSNSGKQLRPILSLLVARALGTPTEDSLHYAASSEVLHNATLIHDDVADNSLERRGKPSLYAEIGARSAVLVGDFWLSQAVCLIVGTERENKVTDLFARTLSNLAEGEMLQLEKASTCDTTEEDYLRIIYCKTASLFETTCRSAALSVDAGQEAADAAGRYGKAVGLAFQIKDDIFDYTGGDGIGKPVGLDLAERKITMPLLGLLRSAPDAGELRAMVRDIPDHPEYCTALRELVVAGGGIEYATSRLDDYVDEALKALEAFPESAEKQVLADLARYNAIRKV